MKKLFIMMAIFTLPLVLCAQTKKKEASKPEPTSGIVKVEKLKGKNVVKYIKLDAKTRSAEIEDVSQYWENGIIYYSLNLKKGQKLLVTALPENLAIMSYLSFSPLEASDNGSFELAAEVTGSYQFSISTDKNGVKYTLNFQLK